MSDTPNYVFEGTPEQKEYAAEMVHNRLRAETRLTSSKAAFWYMGGAGVLLALIGLGVGFAFLGYSRYADVTSTAEKLADTLRTVLEKVTVETKGEVTLRDGEMVLLDGNGQTVKLEPGGTVRVEGGTAALNGTRETNTTPTFKPTQRQLYGSNPTTEALNEVVEFTIFKDTKFGRGSVHTGWAFKSNRDDAPYHQYCYYLEKTVDGNEVKVNLAADGKMVSQPSDRVDVLQAAHFCRWFDGSQTQVTAETRTTPATTPAATVSPSTTIPRYDAPVAEWQRWCRITYPETIQDWCLNNMGPGAKKVTQTSSDAPTSAISQSTSRVVQEPVPTGDGRLRMDPAKVKSF